jgi:uncharacterized membrane protein
MLDSLIMNMTSWHWVALAWGQLILFYLGYLFYLNWRYKNVKRRLEEET